MSEMMKKVKAIPIREVKEFLITKNNYQEVECIESLSGTDNVKIDIDSVSDSFSGTIKGKKHVLMHTEDRRAVDEDSIVFLYKNGSAYQVDSSKSRVDTAQGYVYLRNLIDEDDYVSKIKALLNKEEELYFLAISGIKKTGDTFYSEVTFEANGKLDKVNIKSIGTEEKLNCEYEVRFEADSIEIIKADIPLTRLAYAHREMYCFLNNIKNGDYGYTCKDNQQQSVENAIKTLVEISPFDLEGSMS